MAKLWGTHTTFQETLWSYGVICNTNPTKFKASTLQFPLTSAKTSSNDFVNKAFISFSDSTGEAVEKHKIIPNSPLLVK